MIVKKKFFLMRIRERESFLFHDFTKIGKLAHIRMDFGGIMQSVWNRMEYVALYHILPLAVFSRF